MSMSHSSYLRTPLSDIGFLLAPSYHQFNYNKLCADLEYRFMDCLEAYGSRKAYHKCADLVYDMHECKTRSLQLARVKEIQNERMRQYRAGKLARPFEENPPLDSFMYIQ